MDKFMWWHAIHNIGFMAVIVSFKWFCVHRLHVRFSIYICYIGSVSGVWGGYKYRGICVLCINVRCDAGQKDFEQKDGDLATGFQHNIRWATTAQQLGLVCVCVSCPCLCLSVRVCVLYDLYFLIWCAAERAPKRRTTYIHTYRNGPTGHKSNGTMSDQHQKYGHFYDFMVPFGCR